ncbi:MAG: cupin domain-containing protein [Pseudoflavonifractor sp.]|nr:cupin domain-containing protein [Pseudoflavonifractor sp.]
MLDTEYKFGEVHDLAAQVSQADDHVQFKKVFENANGGVSLLAFKAGQKLDRHLAPAEVMVSVLQGEIEFTIIDTLHTIRAGEFLLMGAGVPHSVMAVTDSKVAVIKVKP